MCENKSDLILLSSLNIRCTNLLFKSEAKHGLYFDVTMNFTISMKR